MIERKAALLLIDMQKESGFGLQGEREPGTFSIDSRGTARNFSKIVSETTMSRQSNR